MLCVSKDFKLGQIPKTLLGSQEASDEGEHDQICSKRGGTAFIRHGRQTNRKCPGVPRGVEFADTSRARATAKHQVVCGACRPASKDRKRAGRCSRLFHESFRRVLEWLFPPRCPH